MAGGCECVCVESTIGLIQLQNTFSWEIKIIGGEGLTRHRACKVTHWLTLSSFRSHLINGKYNDFLVPSIRIHINNCLETLKWAFKISYQSPNPNSRWTQLTALPSPSHSHELWADLLCRKSSGEISCWLCGKFWFDYQLCSIEKHLSQEVAENHLMVITPFSSQETSARSPATDRLQGFLMAVMWSKCLLKATLHSSSDYQVLFTGAVVLSVQWLCTLLPHSTKQVWFTLGGRDNKQSC